MDQEVETTEEEVVENPETESGDMDILGMSDADIMAMDEPPVSDEPEETEGEPEPEIEVNEDEGKSEPEQEEEEVTSKEETTAEADKEENEAEAQETTEEVETTKVDFEGQYNKIMAPFKANGAEITLDSPEQAIQLMQMGANYNKKMAGLKPHLKTMKILDKAGIGQDELNHLIDLHKKNPQAISKLVKDSGHDSFEDNDSGDYVPTNHQNSVSDNEMALEEVLSQIKETPTYQKTIDAIGNGWDTQSTEAIGDNPSILADLNTHMGNGVYDVINAEVQKQKLTGQLTGVSDLDAYKKVGDALQASGGFNHLFTEKTQQEEIKPPVIEDAEISNNNNDGKRNERKRAASSGKAGSPKTTNLAEYNPLNMSDEEFMKKYGNDLL